MKNLVTTKCPECQTEINGKHLKPPFLNIPGDSNFYGGRVKKLIAATCECGIEFTAFLQPINNGYKVIDLAYKNESEQSEKSKTPNIDIMERPELLKYAKELGVEGKLATMKNDKVKLAIKEKLKAAEITDKEDPEKEDPILDQ